MEEPKQSDRISQYERAICYYALPRMVNPVTLGLLMAYTLCVAEALAALAYGVWAENDPWAKAGAASFIGLVLFGIVVFTGRALINEVRQRRFLAAARGVPNAQTDLPDLPDPFAGHVLLCHPIDHPRRHFDCEADNASTRYHVDRAPARDAWEVSTEDGEEVCMVRVDKWAPSFALTQGSPWRMTITKQAQPVAKILHLFSLGPGLVELRMLNDPVPPCRVVGNSIVREHEQVGRLYRLRGNLYLDVRADVLNDALLGYFATLT